MNDDAAVSSVIARAAHTADSAPDLADYLRLWTPDAEWRFGDTVLVGHDAMREAAEARRTAGRAGPGTNSRHVITTVATAVDGDAAVVESYWLFFVNTDQAPTIDSMGAYRDELVRSADSWRIARRTITPG
jgi:hypothetical protein